VKPESHLEIQDLLGPYALDAVSPDEAARIEEHLRDCPRCRVEVEEHRETAAMLAGAGQTAPDGLWERISARLEESPPLPHVARLRRQERARGMNRWVVGGVAAVMLGIMGVLGFRVLDLGERVDDLAARPDPELAAVATAAANDPRSTRVTLRSEDGSRTVTVVVLPDGSGFILGDDLPPLPAERTYQLWALDGGPPISAGILGPDPAVVAFKVAPGTNGLAVTVERAGGVHRTERAPVVVADLGRA
jgi:anti-sigma-K factor RskA